MNVSLRQLRAFIGVAESSNFTRTSQRLHVSQAALSAAVRELESQLDCRLFDRTTRAVELTPAGLAFLPTAKLIVHELEAAALRAREAGRADDMHLKLGFTPLIAAHIVPDVLERFKVAFPGVQVDVTDAGPIELQRAVDSGELDAAFAAFFSRTSGLQHRRVLGWRLLVVSPLSMSDLPKPLKWADLAPHRLIGLHPTSPVQQIVEDYLARNDVVPALRASVNQLETQIALSERGFGLAVLPSFAAGTCRRYDVQLRPVAPCEEFSYSLITRAGRGETRSLAAFASSLAEVIESTSAEMLAQVDA